LNFLMLADIAAANASFSNYANANGASWKLMDPALLKNPAVFPDEAIWEILYPIKTVDPKRERPRTRAFARAKSGI
jgi:putrescine transport system substrate-binding protein